MTDPAPVDTLGVWCRACKSTTFATLKTDRCQEGDIRTHECSTCGHKFGSIATFFDKAYAKGTPLVKVENGAGRKG